ncbi:MAG TPA: hypothetical protein VGU90_07630 [Terriglobales bacterium]|nr:hypothetical protein [Terriglobales bacterium]
MDTATAMLAWLQNASKGIWFLRHNAKSDQLGSKLIILVVAMPGILAAGWARGAITLWHFRCRERAPSTTSKVDMRKRSQYQTLVGMLAINAN